MVYELVWKNQRLNCFTHACSGIDTHMHEKLHTLMHINTHTNDSFAGSPLLYPRCYSCSLERRLRWPFVRGFRFSFLDHCTRWHRYIWHTYINTHTHICTYTGSLAHRRINRKQPKQTLDYTSHYSSRESHQSIWHEAWLSWKWGMLSHTLSLDWHRLDWCELRLLHYLRTWLK